MAADGTACTRSSPPSPWAMLPLARPIRRVASRRSSSSRLITSTASRISWRARSAAACMCADSGGGGREPGGADSTSRCS
eukprot:6303876-Prymnesium_polylepis.1